MMSETLRGTPWARSASEPLPVMLPPVLKPLNQRRMSLVAPVQRVV
jgi:hypothetical protein